MVSYSLFKRIEVSVSVSSEYGGMAGATLDLVLFYILT